MSAMNSNKEKSPPFDFGFDGKINNNGKNYSKKNGQHNGKSGQGVYAIYKKATEAFRDGLAKLLPKGASRLTKVDDYKRGADIILQKSLDVIHTYDRAATTQTKLSSWNGPHSQRHSRSKPPAGEGLVPTLVDSSVLSNLDTCIRLRKEQARKHGGYDIGHGYIMSVLQYCRDVLKWNNSIVRLILATREPDDPHDENNSRRRNGSDIIWHLDTTSRIHPETAPPLLPVSPDPSTILSQPSQSSSKPPSSSPPSFSSSVGVPVGAYGGDEDLTHANDRFQCIAFLETMDRLMGILRNRFDEIKRICIVDGGVQNTNSNRVIYHLMESSIATNLSMECVSSMWAELTLEHPHIRSVYDLLAIVFVVPDLSSQESAQQAAKKKKKGDGCDDDAGDTPYANIVASSSCSHKARQYPHLVTHLVGDVIEACFAVEGLDTSKAVRAYGSKLGLQEGGWEKMHFLDEAGRLARTVCEMVLEQNGSHKIRQSFLAGYKHIGDQRCILNTQMILQRVFAYMMNPRAQQHHHNPTTTKNGEGDNVSMEIAKAGANTFDFVWHEDNNFARSIRGDLDHFLTSEVLSELIAACCNPSGLPVRRNPGVTTLVPLLHSLDKYISSDELGNPVPMELTFGIHALLISVMALQGNGHMEKLGITARLAFTTNLQQLEESGNAFNDDDCGTPRVFGVIRNVAEPACSPISDTSRLNGYWNPLLAGCFCLYGSYMGLMSSVRYLRKDLKPTLHLYNALRIRNILGDDIHFLELLGTIFSKTRAIWMGGKRARQGDFVTNFLHGKGLSIRDVAFLVSCIKNDHGIRINLSRYVKDRNRATFYNPSMAEMLHATDFSYGCRGLYYGDYSGIDEEDDNNSDDDGSTSTSSGDTRMDNGVENVTECEVFIAKGCKALQKDIDLFGGSFIDWVKVGSLLKDFHGMLGKQLHWDHKDCDNNIPTRLDYDDILGELDFAPLHSELVKPSRIAKLMKDHFTVAHWSDYSLSNGLKENGDTVA